MKIINIENNFDEEVKSSKGKTIVDFWAPWCGPCKMFGPVFERVASETDNIKFCKLNVDEDTNDVSKDLGVMSIPTTILFEDGKEKKRNIGYLSEEDLKIFLEDK